MRKIDLNKKIIGADGVERTWEDIEIFFTGLFENQIRRNIEKLRDSLIQDEPYKFIESLNYILDHLHTILTAKPEVLRIIKIETDRVKSSWQKTDGVKDKAKDFYDKILKAFNYTKFRKNQLNRLAVVLNVKTCLYCNQQYTIAVGNNPNEDGDIDLAEYTAYLQFDHFYGKSDYPILSMSLYNLIPCCPFCNQKKSSKHVSLKLHPYVNDLSSMLKFRIKDRNAFVNPKNKDLDLLEVEIETTDDEVKDFAENLDLKKRYARHLDIVQELEVALYLAPYYNSNFEDINQIFKQATRCDSDRSNILQRHFKGFYSDPNDINKRPLTKFSQDIYSQLSSWHAGD